MKFKVVAFISFLCCYSAISVSQSRSQTFFEIKVYHYQSAEQGTTIDNYLENAFIPAFHRNGIKNIGVFKPIGNDTLVDKRIYVLIAFKSPKQFAELPNLLSKDIKHAADGENYLEAAYDKAPYSRIESIFLKSFVGMPVLQLPSLKNELSKRVYELRSYEGPTEKAFARKVEMFNKGGEIALFKRLSFNSVFYGSVFSGSRMPNLMYMTTFEDMASRDAHWKMFFASPEWLELSAMEYYKRSVSKNEIILMHPTSYSEI